MNDTQLVIQIDEVTRDLIDRAAKLRGQTVEAFAETVSLGAAIRVVTEAAPNVFSNRDRDMFLSMLDSPPKPNKALRKAADKYRSQLLKTPPN